VCDRKPNGKHDVGNKAQEDDPKSPPWFAVVKLLFADDEVACE
jgi:hypothetical protein